MAYPRRSALAKLQSHDENSPWREGSDDVPDGVDVESLRTSLAQLLLHLCLDGTSRYDLSEPYGVDSARGVLQSEIQPGPRETGVQHLHLLCDLVVTTARLSVLELARHGQIVQISRNIPAYFSIVQADDVKQHWDVGNCSGIADDVRFGNKVCFEGSLRSLYLLIGKSDTAAIVTLRHKLAVNL